MLVTLVTLHSCIVVLLIRSGLTPLATFSEKADQPMILNFESTGKRDLTVVRLSYYVLAWIVKIKFACAISCYDERRIVWALVELCSVPRRYHGSAKVMLD